MTACGKKGGGSNPPVVPPPVVPPPVVNSDVASWVTTPDRIFLFQKINQALNFSSGTASGSVIKVDSTQTYQTIDGFGYCLTGGSATLIHQLPAGQRAALLQELFRTDSTFIGVSYLRVSIGASDLSARVFSYDDNTNDSTLANFDLSDDKTDLVPLLQEIGTINPSIKILACPWSAPLWMKDNNNAKGGSLQPKFYSAYAKYFVKYIQAMKAAGITIDAITPQNEPLNPLNVPSMMMQDTEEAAFVKNNLGPALQAAGLSTKIIVWDHNADRPEYPIHILNDPDAAKYVDGSAFHLYSGSIDALNTVHEAYPNKNVYFTEQWVGGPGNFAGDLSWHVKNLIIGAPRNWSRNVLEWNLAADGNYGPHTTGGCTTCQGAFTIDGTSVVRNTSYYIVAHAAKWVRPGSVRIASNIAGTLSNVAFKTADGKKVLIVLNEGDGQSFSVQFGGKYFSTDLAKGSVGTYIW